MEIIGDKSKVQDPAVPPPPEERQTELSGSFDDKVVSVLMEGAIEKAKEEEAARKSEDPLPVSSADVAKHAEDDPRMAAAGDASSASLSRAKEIIGGGGSVLIGDEHKRAFIEAVVTGRRYTESFSLFGGNVSIVLRCRSAEETDAIDAYARRKISTGEIKSESEYSNLMRCMLIVAQVQEINGVSYSEMRSPMKFVENETGIKPPAWEEELKMWMAKPDVIISALTGAILEFEARYWQMVAKASDENFWGPGESTGG